MTSQRVKNKKVLQETKSSGVTVVLYVRCDVFCDLLQYTYTRKNIIYLFYTIKIQIVYCRILGA